MADNLDYSAAFEPLMHISQRLNQIYRDIEQENKVIISSPVRNFTEALITEAFAFNRFGSRNLGQIVKESLDAASSILRGVNPVLRNDLRYVTLIGVIEEVHANWCKYFPFCQ